MNDTKKGWQRLTTALLSISALTGCAPYIAAPQKPPVVQVPKVLTHPVKQPSWMQSPSAKKTSEPAPKTRAG